MVKVKRKLLYQRLVLNKYPVSGNIIVVTYTRYWDVSKDVKDSAALLIATQMMYYWDRLLCFELYFHIFYFCNFKS